MLNCWTASDLLLVLYYCFLPMRVTEYFNRLHQLNIVHLCIQIVNWTECSWMFPCVACWCWVQFISEMLTLCWQNGTLSLVIILSLVILYHWKLCIVWYAAAWIRAEVLNINLNKNLLFFWMHRCLNKSIQCLLDLYRIQRLFLSVGTLTVCTGFMCLFDIILEYWIVIDYMNPGLVRRLHVCSAPKNLKKQEKVFRKLGTGGSTTKDNPQIFTNENTTWLHISARQYGCIMYNL